MYERDEEKEDCCAAISSQSVAQSKKNRKTCRRWCLFSAPKRLSSLIKKVNSENKESRKCPIKHAKQFVPCQEGVVYSLPLSCGKRYIGQTGRCLNERLKEHEYNVSCVAISGHVAKHCRHCKGNEDDDDTYVCAPNYHESAVLEKNRDSLAREIIEAHLIGRLPEECISASSIALSEKERRYLDCEYWQVLAHWLYCILAHVICLEAHDWHTSMSVTHVSVDCILSGRQGGIYTCWHPINL